MLRGGFPVSAQDKQQEKQKQKKRLSFKNPEIEGPQKRNVFATAKSNIALSSSNRFSNCQQKNSSSLEDLNLEDQALQIAHSVGNAFSDLSLDGTSCSDALLGNCIEKESESVEESTLNDCSTNDCASYQRNCQLRAFRISARDQAYLDDLKSPLADSTMRGPSSEADDLNQYKNSIPAQETMEERYPSHLQHQIQLLKYQLDQQNQQTQMALHQVQLLSDQMEAESTARRKAQEQNNQLMLQNKELLSHVERLFQQIEELEKQVQALEQEKKSRIPQYQEPQVTQVRSGASYLGIRKGNPDQEKPTQNRSVVPPARKSSIGSTKPVLTQNKAATNIHQSTVASSKKTSSIPQKPHLPQNKTATDSGSKPKDVLRIGDTSPPVLNSPANPFSSSWKFKSEANHVVQDKSTVPITRNRTGSFSSFSKLKPPDIGNAKTSLFGSNNNLPNTTSIGTKKYSSSTSDLYNNIGLQINKPLLIEEPSASAKNSISNLSINPPSKLPRYQAYTSWRRSSLSNDTEQTSKEMCKTSTETSLFGR